MANPEHLHILQQGVEAWNAWREQHYWDDITPELCGADLRRANLGIFAYPPKKVYSTRMDLLINAASGRCSA